MFLEYCLSCCCNFQLAYGRNSDHRYPGQKNQRCCDTNATARASKFQSCHSDGHRTGITAPPSFQDYNCSMIWSVAVLVWGPCLAFLLLPVRDVMQQHCEVTSPWFEKGARLRSDWLCQQGVSQQSTVMPGLFHSEAIFQLQFLGTGCQDSCERMGRDQA